MQPHHATLGVPLARRWLALLGSVLAAALVGGVLVADRSGTGLSSAASHGARPAKAGVARARSAYGKLPLRFEANRGQTNSQVKFISRGAGYTLFLTPREAVISLTRASGEKTRHGAQSQPARSDVLRMRLAGANPTPQVAGVGRLPGTTNYLRGRDAKRSQTGVPAYAKVRYRSVYPGTDVVYYGRQGRLEYDFVVSPGADPSAIALGFSGAKGLSLDHRGDLILKTPAGPLRQHRPVAYQRVGGRKHPVPARYVMDGKRRVGFRLGAYDHRRALVIDPVLSYSTYLGGTKDNNSDSGADVAVDSSGSAYVTGSTQAADFPTTQGAYDRSCASTCDGYQSDAFVTKLDPNGALVYSTYLGGSGSDGGASVSVKPGCAPSSCSAYVSGSTGSTDFPTRNGKQTTRGGSSDAFLTKLNPTGTALDYSTYLGGAGGEGSASVAVDSSGFAYLSGSTDAANFPTTVGAYDRTCGGCAAPSADQPFPKADLFVAKFDTGQAGPASLVYSTYLGGGDSDSPGGIAVNASGSAYVTGFTASTDFPSGTTRGVQSSHQGGGVDAFVAKLNPAGTALDFSTYLGGDNYDFAAGIAVDGAGDAYVAGETYSGNFPTSPGAYQTAKRGKIDAFITKLDPSRAGASSLAYSTYLGSEVDAPDGNTSASAIAVDSSGSAYVPGNTSTGDFPAVGAFQPVSLTSGGAPFVTKLNPVGSTLDYSTYLGGSGRDYAAGIAVPSSCASSCRAYVTGSTGSDDFPTKNAFQPALKGGTDAFVAALDPAPAPAAPAIRRLSATSGSVLGGTSVSISGVNFTGVTAVKFGGVDARSFSVDPSGRTITAVTPAHAAAIADVTVTGPEGSSVASHKTKFLFGLGRWRYTGDLGGPRSGHTETLLSGGKVLVTGGTAKDLYGDPISSAELYDPKTGTWSPTGDLTAPRFQHTATLLTGAPCKASNPPAWCGKVLIAGGADGAFGSLLASAELYDPEATDPTTGRKGRFTALPASMGTARSLHTATLLPDGTVLLAAGCTAGSSGDYGPVGPNCWANEAYDLAPSAEIFNPADNSFSAAGAPGSGRVGHSATLLPNGKVLFVGGTAKSVTHYGGPGPYLSVTIAPAELYDPAQKTWRLVQGDEPDPRADHAATLLPSGKVLIAGGSDATTYATFKESTELYDPVTDAWTNASPEKLTHSRSPAVLLPSGQVLVASAAGDGYSGEAPLTTDVSELFDPSINAGTGTWTFALPTLFGRAPGRTPNHSVTLLSSDPERFAADSAVCGKNCGKVLMAGGVASIGYGADATKTSELYTPAPTITSLSPDSGPAAGGTGVTISGTGFTHDVSEVRFGTTPATSFTVDSFSRITAVSPPAAAGTSVPVTVLNDGGKAESAGNFSYTGAGSPGLSSSGTTGSPDKTAPVASGFGLTNNPFVVGGRTPTSGSAARRRHRRHKKGTTFRYTLSEAATVRIVIAQGHSGRRKGKRCVARTRKLRHAKKCIRLFVKGTLTRTSHKGSNRVAFSGRIGSKALKPGHYQATLTATDAAKNTSKPKIITLTVVKR